MKVSWSKYFSPWRMVIFRLWGPNRRDSWGQTLGPSAWAWQRGGRDQRPRERRGQCPGQTAVSSAQDSRQEVTSSSQVRCPAGKVSPSIYYMDLCCSCGSLLTKSSNGKFSGPDLWNILSASDQSSPITFVTTWVWFICIPVVEVFLLDPRISGRTWSPGRARRSWLSPSARCRLPSASCTCSRAPAGAATCADPAPASSLPFPSPSPAHTHYTPPSPSPPANTLLYIVMQPLETNWNYRAPITSFCKNWWVLHTTIMSKKRIIPGLKWVYETYFTQDSFTQRP